MRTATENSIAKNYLSIDTELVHSSEIWKKHESTFQNKPVYIADIEVIEMFKNLNKLPKINGRFVIPHPTQSDRFINANEFGDVVEEKNLYTNEIDNECWELSDSEVHMVLIKYA